MKTLLEAFENWLAERIQLALSPLLDRVAALENNGGNPTLDARLETLEDRINELNDLSEDSVDDRIESWMDNNLDDNVREAVGNLHFTVEVSRY